MGHFYNKNSIKDSIKLQWLIEKAQQKKKTAPNRKNQYEIAIDVWTIRDIKKINTAIANNLNYIVFWNMTEFDNWINEYINQCK